MKVGGKQATLGYFATAEEAALARARHLWDTTIRLLEQPPQQAPSQGAAGPSKASSYEEEEGFDPADIAAAVSLAALRPAAFRERAEGGEAAGARSRAGGEGGGCSGGGCCPAMGRRGGGGGGAGER